MRRAAKVDLTQRPIVDALRGVGALVWVVGGAIDLVVEFRGHTYLMDTKTGKRPKTPTQRKMVEAGWPIAFPSSVDEALRVIGAIG